jgi:hypothetical protein
MGEPGEDGSACRVVLCHERRRDVPLRALSEHWLTERASLVAELRGAFPYTRYTQVHRVPKYNLIYQVLRWSRSPIGEVLFFPTRLREALRCYRNRPEGRGSQWDIVDQLWFPSVEALRAALGSPAGQEAARRLREDHAARACRTAVVVGEEHVGAPAEGSGACPAKVLFLLRGRAGMSAEEMQQYWGGDHWKLVISSRVEMGYRGFEQVHLCPGEALASAVEAFGGSLDDDVHGVASLSFRGQGAIAGSLISPRRILANRKVLGDELRFLDYPRCSLVFGREHAFPA